MDNEEKNILMLNEMWNETPSNTITDNVINLLEVNGEKTFNNKWDKLIEITGSGKYAVYAWLNRGRSNVKIPFLKLCTIAEFYGVSISDLLYGGNYKMKKKFAVIKVVGYDEKVLKIFDDDKETAIAYGAEIAKDNKEGNICCVQALFNDEDKMSTYEMRIFEVWQGKDKKK